MAQTDLSRNRLQGLIRDGRVRVNGVPGRSSLRLRPGDAIEIELPRTDPEAGLEPENVPLDIVFEDAWLLVLHKPAGVVVHPGAGHEHGTLVHGLLHHVPGLAAIGGPGRPGIVHRLDKGTSGLMVVAKHERAWRGLVAAIQARTVTRIYRALVWGVPRTGAGTIETGFGRDPRERRRMAVVRSGGKPARTHWRVIERFGVASLLEARLDTG